MTLWFSNRIYSFYTLHLHWDAVTNSNSRLQLRLDRRAFWVLTGILHRSLPYNTLCSIVFTLALESSKNQLESTSKSKLWKTFSPMNPLRSLFGEVPLILHTILSGFDFFPLWLHWELISENLQSKPLVLWWKTLFDIHTVRMIVYCELGGTHKDHWG